MGKTHLGTRVRHMAWRLVFAALGSLVAERVEGPSAPFMVAGSLLGFFLGKYLGPLTERALAELDPRKLPEPEKREDRATQP